VSPAVKTAAGRIARASGKTALAGCCLGVRPDSKLAPSSPGTRATWPSKVRRRRTARQSARLGRRSRHRRSGLRPTPARSIGPLRAFSSRHQPSRATFSPGGRHRQSYGLSAPVHAASKLTGLARFRWSLPLRNRTAESPFSACSASVAELFGCPARDAGCHAPNTAEAANIREMLPRARPRTPPSYGARFAEPTPQACRRGVRSTRQTPEFPSPGRQPRFSTAIALDTPPSSRSFHPRLGRWRSPLEKDVIPLRFIDIPAGET
jgi:hypothetical protein